MHSQRHIELHAYYSYCLFAGFADVLTVWLSPVASLQDVYVHVLLQ